MSDTPDFENMSPEEMMRWMESLAKRQGADPTSFTTDADLEIEEVSEDDSRLEETGEYIPYGWTKEKWEAHLAKEAEEKASRAASSPAPAEPTPAEEEEHTTPMYTPEPIAEMDDEFAEEMDEELIGEAIGDEMPDFDSMSPEEAMRWMESLAKRQGADPSSFLTEADMSVAEVSADDERLSQTGEYIPYGWTKEKWEAHLAKEAEEKAAKSSASSDDMLPGFDDVDASMYEETSEDFEFVSADDDDDLTYEADDDDIPYDFDEDDAIDLDALDEEPDILDEATEEPEEAPIWSAVTSDDDEEEFHLEELTSSDEADYEDEVYEADYENEEEPVGAGENPMSWLQNLANDDESAEEIDLSALEEVQQQEAPGTLDPMGWLAELAAENKADTVPDLQNLDLGDIGDNLTGLDEIATSAASEDDGENPIAWIESLARDQGAPSEELTTSADMDIERPTNFIPDGPGYEPYSFETGGKPPVEEEEAPPEPAIDEETVADMDMSDPSAWLDALAAGVSGGKGESRVPDMDDDEDEEVATETISRINAGEDVSPEEVENFFDAMFKQAEQYADRDEDIDEDEDQPSDAIPAEIPDWLQAQMASDTGEVEAVSGEPEMSADEANAMLEKMFGTDEVEAVSVDDFEMPADMMLEEVDDEFALEDEGGEFVLDAADDFAIDEDLDLSGEDIPDWLTEEIGDEASDLADIFATDSDVEDDAPLTTADEPIGVTASIEAIPMDTDDNWVQAFEAEADPSRQQELAAWYAQSTGEEAPANAPVLQATELPLERNLPLGQAELVPDWMVGEIEGDVAVASSVAAIESVDFEMEDEAFAASTDPFTLDEDELVEQDLPDWLADSSPASDMPDWLQTDTVESVDDEDLPEWLNIDADVEVGEIPDWLRETMDEEDETQAITLETAEEEPEEATEVVSEEAAPELEDAPVPAPAVQQPAAIVPAQEQRSPAPIPAAAAQINVAAILENARTKVSSGAVDDSLNDYETVIRANTALDEVVNDLKKLSEDKEQKKNTAVYRVLGDGLMRQGKLQDALETYRKALKML
ncbi:MAG: hypothetical protein CL607_10000 [Anaerolineaceae bacterium]|nr:hypothetical protein [Anaerolineaceae bacterium]